MENSGCLKQKEFLECPTERTRGRPRTRERDCVSQLACKHVSQQKNWWRRRSGYLCGWMDGTSFWWRCSKLSLYLHHVSIRYNSIHNRIFSGRVWITTSLCFGSRKDLLWVKNVLQVSTNIILISLPFIIWVCSYGVFKSSWISH